MYVLWVEGHSERCQAGLQAPAVRGRDVRTLGRPVRSSRDQTGSSICQPQRLRLDAHLPYCNRWWDQFDIHFILAPRSLPIQRNLTSVLIATAYSFGTLSRDIVSNVRVIRKHNRAVYIERKSHRWRNNKQMPYTTHLCIHTWNIDVIHVYTWNVLHRL